MAGFFGQPTIFCIEIHFLNLSSTNVKADQGNEYNFCSMNTTQILSMSPKFIPFFCS